MSEPWHAHQIDAICNEFEEGWTGKSRPNIAVWLVRIDEAYRGQLLRALLEVDIELRRKAGQEVSAIDYQDLGPDAVAFVEEFLRLDSLLVKQVAEALTAHAIPLQEHTDRSERIGNYKLLQKIGEGGMGSVWMAEQETPVKRRVAIKVIKVGLGNRQIIARFEAERQALALMDHQCIARVLDAGAAHDGRPYFVMELVQGVPITLFCDQNKLTIDERLRLFIPVCQAVQHAHQKGIIHRDLKPTNVLVCMYDGKPVPKIIDFGLAKALQHTTHLTDKTLFTEFGQVVGTLQYMSPEQADLDQLDIDTRTDIYSLGVMLYELLTGSTPLDQDTLKKQAILKVLAIIREQDPPWPSARLCSSSHEAVTGISAQRQIEPNKLKNILRGELDWVVMKALEKDRSRRYETAIGLAVEIERYLKGDAVRARPPSRAYLLRKYLGRHKGLVTSAVAILSLLLLAIGATTWGMLRANQLATERDNKATEASGEARNARNATIDAQNRAKESERRRRRSEALRLVALSKQQYLEYPSRAVLLAVEAAEATRQHNEPMEPEARAQLYELLSHVGGRPLPAERADRSPVILRDGRILFSTRDGLMLDDHGHIEQIADRWTTPNHFTKDERWLLLSGKNGVTAYDLRAGAETNPVSMPWYGQVKIDSNAETNTFVSLIDDRCRAWRLSGGALKLRLDIDLDDHFAKSQISQPYLSIATETQLFVHNTYNNQLCIFDLRDPDAQPIALQDMQTVVVSDDGKWLAVEGLTSTDRTSWLYDLDAERFQTKAVDISNSHEFKIPGMHYAHIVGFSPDTKLLVMSHHYGRQIGRSKIWTLDPEPKTLVDLPMLIHAAGFTANRSRLVTLTRSSVTFGGVYGDDGILRVWDISTNGYFDQNAPSIIGSIAPVSSFVLSPIDETLVTTDHNGLIRYWEITENEIKELKRTFVGNARGRPKVQFSPDGKQLVTEVNNQPSGGDYQRTSPARVWDLAGPNNNAVPLIWSSVVSDFSSSWLLTNVLVNSGRQIFWQVETNQIREPNDAFSNNSRNYSFNVVANWLIGRDRLWDLSASNSLDSPMVLDEELRGHDGYNTPALRMSHDRKRLAVYGDRRGSPRYFIKVCQFPSTESVSTNLAVTMKLEFEQIVQDFQFSTSDRWLITEDTNSLNLWNLESPSKVPIKIPEKLFGGRIELRECLFENQDKLVILKESGGVGFLDFRNSLEEPTTHFLKGHRILDFEENRALLLTHKENEGFSLWDLKKTDLVSHSIKLEGGQDRRDWRAQFSANGRRLVAYDRGPETRVWTIGNNNEPSTVRVYDDIKYESYLSDSGKWLAYGYNETVQLIDLDRDSAKPVRLIMQGGATEFEFSSDGKWLFTGSRKEGWLWDLGAEHIATSGVRLPIPTDGREVFVKATFSRDGRWLATFSENIQVWPLPEEKLISTALVLAGGELTKEEKAVFGLE